jgi:RimJ/RimL family protein N-acetyltransferase
MLFILRPLSSIIRHEIGLKYNTLCALVPSWQKNSPLLLPQSHPFPYISPMLSVRPARLEDYPHIVDYFLNGDKEFHLGMGVESSKLPKREDWLTLLHENHHRPLEKKSFFYVIWEYNGEAIGHSNINKIVFGQEAYTHLHMWRKDVRQKGLGQQFMTMSLPYYFREFNLQTLFCEPYAGNEAPNKTLRKLGFVFERTYETTPGWINFHQLVNRWNITRERFSEIHHPSTTSN